MLSKIKNLISKIFFKEKIEKFDNKIKLIEELLSFKVNQPNYYIKAITHRSIIDKNPLLKKSNERLEFLGDSVLGMVVANYLFNQFSTVGEGQLTKYRSHLVQKETLAEIAEKMDLKSIVIYDRKFIKSYQEGIKTITADALEALIGAIYLDQGLEKAEKFIYKWVILPNYKSGKYQEDNNFKGQLLEFTHAKEFPSPLYEIIEESGPEHDKLFSAKVEVEDIATSIGTGKNKKSAEQDAAQKLLKKIKSQ